LGGISQHKKMPMAIGSDADFTQQLTGPLGHVVRGLCSIGCYFAPIICLFKPEPSDWEEIQ
jgi:hypothetical protein